MCAVLVRIGVTLEEHQVSARPGSLTALDAGEGRIEIIQLVFEYEEFTSADPVAPAARRPLARAGKPLEPQQGRRPP
jgi:hypothetical protein